MERHLACLGLALALATGCGDDESTSVARFRVIVQPEVTAFPGADTWVKVTLERDEGFTDDVDVVFAGGDGLYAPELRFTTSMSNGYLLVSVGLNVETEKQQVPVLVRSGNTVVNEAVTLDVREPQPFAQELIESARLAGKIDDGTALLYRALAARGDPALPEAYWGAGSFEEDNFLLTEIDEALPTLSNELQEQLQQFTVRPSDASSYWNAGLPAQATTRANGALPPESCAELTAPGFHWISQRSESNPVRVWITCKGDYFYDSQSMEMLAEALATLDTVWTHESDLMDDVLLDGDGGGDDAIDVYIDRGPGVARDGQRVSFTADQGQAFPDRAEKSTSGYILVRDVSYGTTKFRTTLVHELFHVHQFRYNTQLGPPKSWFYEASATWATAYFDKKLWPNRRGAYAATHTRFHEQFQLVDESLNHPNDLHERAAYIWPYFIQQAGGGPKVVADIWKNLAAADSPEQADDVIDAAYPFDEHFREFALRNVNEELTPGDPLPENQRHIHGDEDFRDDGAPPLYFHIFDISDELSSEGFEVSIKPLRARYLKFTVAPNIKQLIFTLPDPVAFPELDIDVLVKKNGTWESKPRDLNGKEELKLCEPVEELRFILSNPQRLPGQVVETALAVTASTSECMAGWHGTASHQIDDGLGTSLRLEADVTWVLDPNQSGPGMEVYYATGTVTLTQTKVDCTVTWMPTTAPIEQDMMSSLIIYPDGADGFLAFGNALTIWDSTRTDDCPLNTPPTVTTMGQAGGNWFQTNGAALGPNGNTLIGSNGVAGDVYEWSFTKD